MVTELRNKCPAAFPVLCLKIPQSVPESWRDGGISQTDPFESREANQVNVQRVGLKAATGQYSRHIGYL